MVRNFQSSRKRFDLVKDRQGVRSRIEWCFGSSFLWDFENDQVPPRSRFGCHTTVRGREIHEIPSGENADSAKSSHQPIFPDCENFSQPKSPNSIEIDQGQPLRYPGTLEGPDRAGWQDGSAKTYVNGAVSVRTKNGKRTSTSF